MHFLRQSVSQCFRCSNRTGYPWYASVKFPCPLLRTWALSFALQKTCHSEDVEDDEDIDAISELMTRETLFEVMGLAGGSFEFQAQPVPHDLPPEKLMVAEQILMDGMRMQDEWQTFADRVPAQGAALEVLAPVDDYCQRLVDGGQGGAERVRLVFHFVDGVRSAREIIDLSRLGTFTEGRILADLRASGLIEVVSPTVDPTRKRRRSAVAKISGFARLALAAGIPLALLAGVTLGLFLQASPTGSAQGRSIAHRPLEEARAQFARQRLHNLLEARRHGTGLWPHSLEFLAQDACCLLYTSPSPRD